MKRSHNLNKLWAVYQLADDPKTYGKNAGKWIITADEDDTEVTGVIHEVEVAEHIVELHNFAVMDRTYET